MLREILPPNSLAAEQAALGSALISHRAAAALLSGVGRTDFYLEANRLVYDACDGLARTGHPVDLLTVEQWLRDHHLLERIGGAKYLHDLSETVPTAAHVDTYLKTVREKSKYRWLIENSEQIIRRAYAEETDPDTLQTELLQAILRQTGPADDVHDLRMVAMEEAERVERRETIPALHTGIVPIDRLARGIQRGEVGVICGRPATGKTAAGLQIACYAAETWGPCWMVSLEMDSSSLARRVLARETGLSYYSIRDAGMWNASTHRIEPLSPYQEEQLAQASTRFATMRHPLYVSENCNRLPRLVQLAHTLKARQGIEAIIVDYGQLVKDETSARRSRVEEVAVVAEALKHQVARSINVPVYVLVQANREVARRAAQASEKTRERASLLTMADLGWTGQWEQVAFQVHLLNLDPNHPADSESTCVPIIWEVAKNRNGGTGKADLLLNKPRFQFAARFTEELLPEEPRLARDPWYGLADLD